MPSDQIYHDGRHYDRLYASPRALPSFWSEVADAYGDPILELACGTGRIALPLAEQGHQITGIDLSAAMLAEARRKSTERGLAVDWQLADMRAFDLGRTFKLAILAANALCHLYTLADFAAGMAAVRRHLAVDGRFIVQVFVPDVQLLALPAEERRSFGKYEDPDGAGQIVVTYRARYDPVTQIRHNTTYYRFPGQPSEVTGTLPMRMYFPQELDALFSYNGFTIEHKYGDFERRPFDESFETQLFILTKT
jgi:SAM-dependent methyltransferase